MNRLFIISAFLLMALTAVGRNVTLKADNQPASVVFRSIMEQTGHDFVYSSDILRDMKVSIDVKDQPLKKVLRKLFDNTSIEYKIKGKNIILKKKSLDNKGLEGLDTFKPMSQHSGDIKSVTQVNVLDEVVITSRLESPRVETAEMGAVKISSDEIINVPALFGEIDVLKALQTRPGIIGAVEGMAAMLVDGGNGDENMYMLDNVPLYQVNHFAGLFSSFNPELIRYIDFFKTSIPAKYNGRLSSFMDVRLNSGNPNHVTGSARLGLTSCAFNISGPIGKKTTYAIGLRRSWVDILTAPIIALDNAGESEKTNLRYYFMDLNMKITHRVSPKLNGFVSFYTGIDYLKSGTKDLNVNLNDSDEKSTYDEKDYFKWGNIVVSGGLNYRIRPALSAEFTASFTRYFSMMKSDYSFHEVMGKTSFDSRRFVRTDNNISDWIFRGDFDWIANDRSRLRFGAGYTRHSFLPELTSRRYSFENNHVNSIDTVASIGADEVMAYVEENWKLSSRFSAVAGLNGSLFNTGDKNHFDLSPRVSFNYNPTLNVAFKAAYSHTTQYVHQLSGSYLLLPTDRWIPVTGSFKPQTADKVAAGVYWQSDNGDYAAMAEGYYKQMHNLVEYKDEYYLLPMNNWDSQLTSGKGSARGIDFMFEKKSGRITGNISYSLLWADRTFKGKNQGKTYPAQFDNRHTFKLSLSWKASQRVTINAFWVGHSGNMITLPVQSWEAPGFDTDYRRTDPFPLKTAINNYRLPFYHRLDLSFNVSNKRGYWTFGLYNAYCHLNTVGVKRSWDDTIDFIGLGWVKKSGYSFKRVKMLPLIPSVSYTWKF